MQPTISTPWWNELDLRQEVVDSSGVVNDIQVSLFRVVYGSGGSKPPYASPSYYGRITHPTPQLVDLLTRIAIRLSGDGAGDGNALTRLDQGMGGGKSHACIGAWHLATDPVGLAQEDIGRAVFDQARAALGTDLTKDLHKPHTVVLSCDNLSPGAPDPEYYGPWAYNLYECFLWRLFDGLPDQEQRFESYRPHCGNKSKIGEAIASLNRPVLIIIDEILNYIGDGLESTGNEQLQAQDMTFLRALTDAVTTVPRTAMLVVMIDSEKDPTTLAGGGQGRRQDLQAHLQRNGQALTVNENADFTAILRRRLFDRTPPETAVTAAVDALQPVMAQDNWKAKVFGGIHSSWTQRFSEEVARTYPFHPQLMELAEHEWAKLTGFQQVRSTIRIFAATVYSLMERAKRGGWVPVLIGPGDLPLSNSAVRDAVIGSGLITDTKTQGNYRSIAQSDIVDLDDAGGAARRLDLFRPEDTPWRASNPRAAERAATMIYLASIVGTRGAIRGASDPEVKAATVVTDPAYDFAEADSLVHMLTDADDGLATVEIHGGQGGRARRYYMSTHQRLPMLLRAMRNSVTDADREGVIAQRTEKLLRSGPFDEILFVPAGPERGHRAVLMEAGLDRPRTTRLVALDPTMFTLGNGTQQETMAAVRAVLGAGPDRVPVEWASSIVFVIASGRHHSRTRQTAADYLAYERVLNGPEVEEDDAMQEEATSGRNEARKRLDDAINRAFQHVLYLAQPDPTVERDMAQLNLEQSTLDGEVVWEELAAAQKTFRRGAFTSTALLYNLRESDYGRPLSEVRDAFWSAPRLSLLPDGISDLRNAVYKAVHDDELRIVRSGGEPVAVTGPAEINFNAPTYQLAKPSAKSDEGEENGPDDSASAGSDHSGSSGGAGTERTPTTGDQSPTDDEHESVMEQRLAFTVMKNLVSAPQDADTLAQVFRQLFDVLDRHKVSYLQTTLQIHLPSAQAQEIKNVVESMGIKVTIRDQ